MWSELSLWLPNLLDIFRNYLEHSHLLSIGYIRRCTANLKRIAANFPADDDNITPMQDMIKGGEEI